MQTAPSTALAGRGQLGIPARWLLSPDDHLPAETRLALLHSLYGSHAIFIGGALNTIAVSAVIATRLPYTPFLIWVAAEVLVALARLLVLLAGRRAIAEGRPGPVGIHLTLGLAWGISVGYGTFITMLSGDWIAATLACLSAAAMVGGICFRNFAAPRLVAAMIALSLGPCAIGAMISGEPILLLIMLQVPLYLTSMTIAARHLNRLLVSTMLAERENDRRATHDMLTGALNRAGLAREVAERTAAGTPFALFYLDLDGFKAVNDSLGHQAGDEMLKAVAERLSLVAKPDSAVARIGGDEFVILSSGTGTDEVSDFGALMVGAIADGSYRLGSDVAEVGASVGVALFPHHGRDLGALLGEADTALYRAKFWGRSRCVLAGSATRSAPATAFEQLERTAA
jgi:diguanylate cyclase (GGDEF)-like protein